MGRDIHLFVEYDDRNNVPFSTSGVRAFADGQFCISRDYRLFQCLAGAGGADFLRAVAELKGNNVRVQAAEARQILAEMREHVPLIAPRGLPTHYSEAVDAALFMPVRDDGQNEPWMHDWPTRAEADEWVAKGDSVYSKESNGCVSIPGYHTVSYLSLKEIYQSLRHYGIDINTTPLEFRAVVAAMEQLDSTLERTRIVFWFDN